MVSIHKYNIKVKVIYGSVKVLSSPRIQNIRSSIWAQVQIVEINFIKMYQ